MNRDQVKMNKNRVKNGKGNRVKNGQKQSEKKRREKEFRPKVFSA